MKSGRKKSLYNIKYDYNQPNWPWLTPPFSTGTPLSKPYEEKANDRQIAGEHYKKLNIQPWDFIWQNDLDFFQGEILAYITRWKDKNGIEDLRKASHVLSKYIELNEKSEK